MSFLEKEVLFILALSVCFLGFFDAIRGDFLGNSGNSPLSALSAKSEASSILAEKQNSLGLTVRGESVRLKECSRGNSSPFQVNPGEPCLNDLGFFSVLKAPAFLLRTEGVSALIFLSIFGSSCPDLLIYFTESVIISRISKSANPASFNASILSRKLAIMCFGIKNVQSRFGQNSKIESSVCAEQSCIEKPLTEGIRLGS